MIVSKSLAMLERLMSTIHKHKTGPKCKRSAKDDQGSQSHNYVISLYLIFKLMKSNPQKVRNNRNKLSSSSTHKFKLSKSIKLVLFRWKNVQLNYVQFVKVHDLALQDPKSAVKQINAFPVAGCSVLRVQQFVPGEIMPICGMLKDKNCLQNFYSATMSHKYLSLSLSYKPFSCSFCCCFTKPLTGQVILFWFLVT